MWKGLYTLKHLIKYTDPTKMKYKPDYEILESFIMWKLISSYRVFHRFRQAKFANGSSIISLSQFLLLLQLTQKTKLTLKVFKIDSK